MNSVRTSANAKFPVSLAMLNAILNTLRATPIPFFKSSMLSTFYNADVMTFIAVVTYVL